MYETSISGYFIGMNDEHLIWKTQGSAVVYQARVFQVRENSSVSPEGALKVFTTIDAPDWAIVVPVIETARGREFVMVRQWRHGAGELSLEFPGGVLEKGEDGAEAAARELREETAYSPGRIVKLGEMSPNPAIMANKVHFFLAEDLQDRGTQNLDDDEFVTVERVPLDRLLKDMGRPPFIHALMASALALYLKKTAGPQG
jgi:8-oxo-dGTP pyrophosphatase MutT (NUDIX family)